MGSNLRESTNSSIFVVAIITFAVFVISFTAFYTKENFSSVCGCNLPIWVIIISIASFGMFVGSLIYYLLNKNILKEKASAKHSIEKFMGFLDKEERKILNFLIKNSGKVYQSRISKDLEMNKVKTFRILNQMEKKGILKKEKQGMTNLVILNEDLQSIF